MNSKLRKSTAMFLASGLELASRFLGTRGFVELSTSRLLVVASFRRPSCCHRIFEQMKKDAIDIIIHGTQYLNNSFEMEEPSYQIPCPAPPDSKWP
jgi:hypothetical protein